MTTTSNASLKPKKHEAARGIRPNRWMSSPVHGPAVLSQELLASLLQCYIRSKICHTKWLSSQRIRLRPLEVLDHGRAVVGVACLRDNGIVHNCERNAVDEIVRDLLRPWSVAVCMRVRRHFAT